MDIQQALARLVDGGNLDRAEMAATMHHVMAGECSDAQIGGLLVALRMKGETIEEIAGAVEVMRGLAVPVTISDDACDHLVDLVGTGGDGANLFNVSTAATFVVAAAGAKVAKHGNRSVSSTSGSSDVLEELGVPLDLTPEQVGRAVEQVGLGFMFAPAHHSAMRHAIGPRRELGMRTLFNILGPLTNPANVKRQLIGVFSADLCLPVAQVLKMLGSKHVMVVHADDGLDEISIAADTQVAELLDGNILEYKLSPSDFSYPKDSLEGLSVNSAQESAQLIRDALSGKDCDRARRAAAMITLNAGICIYVSGIAATQADGVALAEDLVSTGQAEQKMLEFVEFTQLASAGAQ
jgi:anthranilate phosphoribosyltransferase